MLIRGFLLVHFFKTGNDNRNPSRYHPFYITDSSEGGYGQKSEQERSKQKYFAGVREDSGGYPFPTAGMWPKKINNCIFLYHHIYLIFLDQHFS